MCIYNHIVLTQSVVSILVLVPHAVPNLHFLRKHQTLA